MAAKSRPLISRYISLIAVLLLAFSTAACSAKKSVPVGTIPQAEKPVQSDVYKTAKAIAYMEGKKGRKPHQGCKFYKRTKKVLDRITTAAGVEQGTWPLYMVNAGREVNAAAVNQNTIIVYEGLLGKVKSDDELAVVLAHEVGHILAKHGKDKDLAKKKTAATLGRTLLTVGAVIGAAAAGADADSAKALGRTAYGLGGMAGASLITQYDRDQEYEADHVGLMLMAKAGYNPKAALGFWDRASEVFGRGSSMSFLKTHPSHSNREDAIKKAMPVALEYYKQATSQQSASSR